MLLTLCFLEELAITRGTSNQQTNAFSLSNPPLTYRGNILSSFWYFFFFFWQTLKGLELQSLSNFRYIFFSFSLWKSTDLTQSGLFMFLFFSFRGLSRVSRENSNWIDPSACSGGVDPKDRANNNVNWNSCVLAIIYTACIKPKRGTTSTAPSSTASTGARLEPHLRNKVKYFHSTQRLRHNDDDDYDDENDVKTISQPSVELGRGICFKLAV